MNNEEKNIPVEETVNEVETQEEETQAISQEDTYWEQVGIHDGIGTVYNGETVKLVHSGENASCINAGYEFEETAGFLQFAEMQWRTIMEGTMSIEESWRLSCRLFFFHHFCFPS